MTNRLKNVPELRFPEFDGEWRLNIFDDMVSNKSSKYSPNNNESIIDIELDSIESNTGRLIKSYTSNEFSSQKNVFKKNQVLYSKLRPYLNKYHFPNFDGVCTSEIWVLDSKNNSILSNEFLYYFIQTSKFSEVTNKSAGSKMPRADWSLVGDLRLNIASTKEQDKIIRFFSKLDQQIELEEQKLEKLKEQKKGYMQNIFAQKLHFKDENGNKYPDWTVKTLNEVFEVSKKRNKNNEYSHKDVLSVSREHGVINQIKYHGRSYAAKTVENYKIVKPHDLIYTKSPLKGAPYGIFKVTTEEGIISPLYAVYTSLNENITDFVSYYFEFNNITTHYLSKLVSKGAKNTINVTDEMALTGKVILPNSEKEVTQIVNFFNKIRELIKKQRKKIELLKERKKGFLQKMFV